MRLEKGWKNSGALRCVALRCVALRCVALRCVALREVVFRTLQSLKRKEINGQSLANYQNDNLVLF